MSDLVLEFGGRTFEWRLPSLVTRLAIAHLGATGAATRAAAQAVVAGLHPEVIARRFPATNLDDQAEAALAWAVEQNDLGGYETAANKAITAIFGWYVGARQRGNSPAPTGANFGSGSPSPETMA